MMSHFFSRRHVCVLAACALSVVLALSVCPLPSPHALRSSRVMASRTARMSAATSKGPWPSEALQSSTSTDSREEERDLRGYGGRGRGKRRWVI